MPDRERSEEIRSTLLYETWDCGYDHEGALREACRRLAAAESDAAAKDRRIAELEALRCDCDEDAGPHHPMCVLEVHSTAVAMRERIAELEAEVAALREAHDEELEPCESCERQVPTSQVRHGDDVNLCASCLLDLLSEDRADRIREARAAERDEIVAMLGAVWETGGWCSATRAKAIAMIEARGDAKGAPDA